VKGDLQYYKNLERALIEKINGLKEEERKYRERFPANTCVQQRLNELLKPILDEISKHNATLQKVQWVIKEAAKTNKQRLAEEIDRLRQGAQSKLKGKNGRDGRVGKNGVNAESKKCG
jgi:predicted transcriptional regulator